MSLFVAIACCFAACRPEDRHVYKHHILARDHAILPPVAMQMPELDSPCNLLRTTRDSTSIVWLLPRPHYKDYKPEDVALFHIYTVANRFYFTIYYPRTGGLYSVDSSFTAYMYRTKVTPELIEMTSSAVTYYYVPATHQWYYGSSLERLPQVPSLQEVNKYIAHYINTAKKTDTNTLVRFGDVVMRRIYHYGDNWYLANYTTTGADIDLLRKSEHPLGTRFDYASLEEQRAVFNLTIQPFITNKLSADENFKRHTHYFVVAKNGMVYRFNKGTDSLEEAVKPQKAWQYKYAYYDSIFYYGPRWVDSVYKLKGD